MGISSERKEAIEEFCQYGESIFGFNDLGALRLALVASGDRPGCSIGVDDEHRGRVEEILDNGNFAYKFDGHSFLIADSERHIRSTSPTRGPRNLGKFPRIS